LTSMIPARARTSSAKHARSSFATRTAAVTGPCNSSSAGTNDQAPGHRKGGHASGPP
jgi:hypothetical protein